MAALIQQSLQLMGAVALKHKTDGGLFAAGAVAQVVERVARCSIPPVILKLQRF